MKAPLNIDPLNQPVPFRIYNRFVIPNSERGKEIGVDFFYQVDYGYTFRLKSVTAIYDDSEGQIVDLKLVDVVNSVEIIQNNVALNLVSTPGGGGAVASVPNPYVDRNGISRDVAFSSTREVSSLKQIDYLEPYKGTLKVNAKIDDVINGGQQDTICDVVLFGYLITNES